MSRGVGSGTADRGRVFANRSAPDRRPNRDNLPFFSFGRPIEPSSGCKIGFPGLHASV